MTALSPALSASRSFESPRRILAVTKLHFVNRFGMIWMPLIVLGAIFLLNLAIWWIITISTGNDSLTVSQGNHSITVSAGSSTITAGQSITLQVGANSIVVNTQGVTINGTQIGLTASAQLQANGGGQMTLQAGMISIN